MSTFTDNLFHTTLQEIDRRFDEREQAIYELRCQLMANLVKMENLKDAMSDAVGRYVEDEQLDQRIHETIILLELTDRFKPSMEQLLRWETAKKAKIHG